MKRMSILIILGISVGLNIAFAASFILNTPILRQPSQFGRQPTNGGEPNKEDVWCNLHRELDVSQEQWEKLEPVMRRFQENAARQRKRIRALRANIFASLQKDDVKREKIQDLQRRLRKAQAKMQDLVLDHILQEKKVLTKRQTQQFMELLDNRIQCRGRRGASMQRTSQRRNRPRNHRCPANQ